MKGMPTPLVLALVVAMLFGVMNIASGLGSCLGVASVSSQPSVAMPPPLDVPFDALMERAQWIAMGSMVLALVLQVPTGLALVGGAFLVVYRHPLGAPVLRSALMAAPLVELLITGFGLTIQAWMLGPTQELLTASMHAVPPGSLPPWFGSLPLVILVITGVALVASLAWLTLKLGLYAYAWSRFRNEAVVAWFAEGDQ
ncbi:MAG: hypothetical protein KC912_06860 [Proteobacteria bacterium]|nr:hypothetical protein [Pseudomonadota bacterium]